MVQDLPAELERDIWLAGPDETDALGSALAGMLRPGDSLLLSGPIGAGKSQLARALIRAALAAAGEPEEDIPSPTYTLVQTYRAGTAEIWHADLYRLTHPDEVLELGLETAFNEAICIVEWPDRLGEAAPESAVSIALSMPDTGDGRRAHLVATAARWRPVFRALTDFAGAPA